MVIMGRLINSDFEGTEGYKPPKNLNTNGAEAQNRTADTRIFSPLLYRLSYLGTIQ